MHSYALRAIPLMYENISFRPVLKCLCSGHLENAEKGAEVAGFERTCVSWREICSMPDIDVVSVCTPNALHEEMVTELMKAGKHLYIDKPLATDAAAAERILRIYRQSNIKAQLAMNNRFLPAVLRAKELMREGAIGDVLSFNSRYLHSGSIDPLKPMGWKQGAQGGVILDLGAHALDLLSWLCGDVAEVSCATRVLYPSRPTRDGGRETELSEDHALMTLRLENGALGYCEVSKITTGANDELTFEICGTRGALRFDLMEPGWLWYYDNTLPERPLGGRRGFTRIECVGRYPAPAGSFPPPKNAPGWDRGHIHCYYTFLDCVANDKDVECGIEDAVRLQRLMQAAHISARAGAWQKVPRRPDEK